MSAKTATNIVWLINLLALTVLTWRTIEIYNDKAPALFAVYYIIIMLVNYFLWFGFRFFNKPIFHTFRKVTYTLLGLFIPAILIISFYE